MAAIQKNITRVVILGGEGSEWIVASALANSFKEKLHISVLNGNFGEVNGAISTVQSAQTFHNLLGINEKEFITKTHAGIKLGTQYSNWTDVNSQFVHSLTANGFSLNGNEFHHYLQRLHAAGSNIQADSFSISAQAALQNRFAMPSSSQPSIYSSLAYAYHVGTRKYIEYFYQYALTAGIVSLACDPLKLVTHEDGSIQQLLLQNGKAITADLWIDCSGHTDSILAKKNSYTSWFNHLPINTVLRTTYSKTAALELLTHLQLHPKGWLRQIHLENETIAEFYFSNKTVSDAEAFKYTSELTNNAQLSQPEILSLHCGTRNKHWDKNCLFMGAAAGYLTELTIPSLHLVHSAVLRLIELFPVTDNHAALANEYNRITLNEYENVRDIHQLQLQLAKQNSLKPITLSETLNYKMQLFKQFGKVAFYEEETCSSGVWASLFLGLHYWPESADMMANAMPLELVSQKLMQLKETLYLAAKELPPYSNYWKQLIENK